MIYSHGNGCRLKGIEGYRDITSMPWKKIIPQMYDYTRLYKTTTDMKQVCEFLQRANKEELISVPGLSTKKADVIILLRPFQDWADTLQKFQKEKLLSPKILNAVRDKLRLLEGIRELMTECERISKSLEIKAGIISVDKNIGPLELNGIFGSTTQPKSLNPSFQLTQYQILGVHWLNFMGQHKLNCILADEMGLGKTVQVIAFLAMLYEKGSKGLHLIIVPSSTLENWVREFSQWCPILKVVVYSGSIIERKNLRAELKQILEGRVPMDAAVPPAVIITT